MNVQNALRLGAILLSSVAIASPGHAQSARPTSVSGVIAVCTPVINTEYSGDLSPWGNCVNAVGAFLETVPTGGSQVVDLVVALTDLYRSDANCRIGKTELPLAIARAADFASSENDQRERILLISATVEECDQVITAAIDTRDRPGSAF